MSSSIASVWAASSAAASSSVKRLRSSSDLTMASRRAARASSCSSRSRMLVTATSSSESVSSLRYRAMKGMVAPSSSSWAVASTCRGRRWSSVAIVSRNLSFMGITLRRLSEQGGSNGAGPAVPRERRYGRCLADVYDTRGTSSTRTRNIEAAFRTPLGRRAGGCLVHRRRVRVKRGVVQGSCVRRCPTGKFSRC